MASLYITEYSRAGADGRSVVPIGEEPAIASQKLTISGTAAASAAFNTNTKIVRIHTDAICSILFGAAPVATDAYCRLAAGQTEYFAVKGGDKVSVISNT